MLINQELLQGGQEGVGHIPYCVDSMKQALPTSLEVLRVRVCVCMLSLQSCPILCDPVDCSLPGSSVHGILQARILEWVAFLAPGDLPEPGTESESTALQADSLPLNHWGSLER